MSATAFVSNDVQSYTAFGSQSAVDTPATTYTFAKYLDGAGMEHSRETTLEREGGSGQDLTLAYVQHHTGNANIPVYARPEITLRALAYAMGQATRTSAASTWPYTHEVYPADEARLLTYEQYAPGKALGEQLVNAKISELTIEGEHGKPVKITARITGGDSPRNRDSASARTVALETEDPWFFNQASHQVALAGSYEGNPDVTKWKVTWTRNMDDSVFGAGYGRQALPEQNREVSVEFTRRFADASAHQALNYGGGSTVAASAATGGFKVFMTNGQAGSALRSWELEVPVFIPQSITRNAFEPDGNTVYEDVSGMAIKGATHIMRAQIKNLVPTHVASGLL